MFRLLTAATIRKWIHRNSESGASLPSLFLPYLMVAAVNSRNI